MTILFAVVIGLASAALLLLAGHRLGLSQGRAANEELWAILEGRGAELQRLFNVLDGSLRQYHNSQQALSDEINHRLTDLGAQPGGGADIRSEIGAMLTPLLERDRANEELRLEIRDLLGPILERERIGQGLAQLDLGTGQREELPRLLADIADTGGFTMVMVTDDGGLPLAASAADGADRFAAVSSLLLVLIERLARQPGPDPVAVAVHDAAGQQTLSRIFRVGGQQLLLTAASTRSGLSPTMLDPAVAKLQAVLVANRPTARP